VSDDGTYNAGTEATLQAATDAALARARATGHPVNLYQHVGGTVAGKVVHATGKFMWRDTLDGQGHELPPPRWSVWRLLETVG
jgi:hypothetical protein